MRKLSILAALAGLSISSAALADPYVVVSGDLVASAGEKQGQKTTQDTAQAAGPLSFDQTANAISTSGASSYVHASATADYGKLDFEADGQSAPLVGNGASALFMPYVGGGPVAMFSDDLSVVSDTLALGTAVELTFDLAVHGHAYYSSSDLNDHSTGADVAANFFVGGPFGQQLLNLTYDNGDYSEAISLTTFVGAQLTLKGALFAYGTAAGAGYSTFHIEDPSTVNIESDTAGARIVAASGHDYGLAVAVPEPASWTLMLGGFTAIGGALRWRRKAAPTTA